MSSFVLSLFSLLLVSLFFIVQEKIQKLLKIGAKSVGGAVGTDSAEQHERVIFVLEKYMFSLIYLFIFLILVCTTNGGIDYGILKFLFSKYYHYK
jgi:hypothetical protein